MSESTKKLEILAQLAKVFLETESRPDLSEVRLEWKVLETEDMVSVVPQILVKFK